MYHTCYSAEKPYSCQRRGGTGRVRNSQMPLIVHYSPQYLYGTIY